MFFYIRYNNFWFYYSFPTDNFWLSINNQVSSYTHTGKYYLVIDPIIPNYRYHIKIKWKFFRQPPLPSGELGEGVFFCLKYSPFTALWQLHICASGTHPTGRRAGKHKSGYSMTDQCEKNRTILSGNYLWLYCPWWGRMRWYRSEIMILPRQWPA